MLLPYFCTGFVHQLLFLVLSWPMYQWVMRLLQPKHFSQLLFSIFYSSPFVCYPLPFHSLSKYGRQWREFKSSCWLVSWTKIVSKKTHKIIKSTQSKLAEAISCGGRRRKKMTKRKTPIKSKTRRKKRKTLKAMAAKARYNLKAPTRKCHKLRAKIN